MTTIGYALFNNCSDLLDGQGLVWNLDANGNFVARPFGGSGAAGYPLQHSTFYAPGAPRSISVTLKYALH